MFERQYGEPIVRIPLTCHFMPFTRNAQVAEQGRSICEK